MADDKSRKSSCSDDERVAYSAAETARRTGTNEKTVRASMERGEIPMLKIGRRKMVPAWWIRQQLTGAGKAA